MKLHRLAMDQAQRSDLYSYYIEKHNISINKSTKQNDILEHEDPKSKSSLVLVKPNCFMNVSGLNIIEAVNDYKLDISNLIVFCDDLETELGKVKISLVGGDRGHNGLKSINDTFCSNDYLKVKIGVGRPTSHNPKVVSDFVLGSIPLKDLEVIKTNAFPRIEKELDKLFKNNGNSNSKNSNSKKSNEKKNKKKSNEDSNKKG